ncbi:MAG: hypothetical protein RLZZ546_576 [Bacteroidota bacterium]
MRQKFDTKNWNRHEHYEFFKKFDQPFFGFTVNVKCNNVLEYCSDNNFSFFLFYLHKIMLAINEVKNLKLRICEDEVYLYDTINISPTIGRSDHTFGFSYMDFEEDFKEFHKRGKLEIERVMKEKGLCLSENASRPDVVHFSSIPWFSFTSVSHARNFSYIDSVPKISLGRIQKEDKNPHIPLSIHAHHALADGYDVALFFEKIEKYLNLQ